MGDYRMCLFFVRKFKSTKAGPPQDIRDLFKKYAKGGDRMTAEQLRSFLVEIQGAGDGDGFSVAELEKVVEQVLEKTRPGSDLTERATLTLTLDDFHHYLFSADLNPPIRDQVYQDMTKPLSHYFIYTGHNSYLTGNQLSSNCSDLPIIEALKRGVRVIELDLWPNNNKDDVHVVHGRTLTTPVKLDRCLESIRKHAFVSSPYPVIVTLEDHLTPDLQAKVAEVISKIFGGMLYCPEQPLDEFPSPEDLKYKILISTKPPKKHHTAGNAKSTENTPRKCFPSILKVRSSDDDSWGKVSLPSDLTDNQEDEAMSDTYTSEDSDDESSPTTSGVLAYESLIAIHAGKPKGGLKEALQVELNKVRRLSLSEQRLEKATKDHKMDVIRFTQKNVLRVYPRGTRFNSSNYKPLIAWMHGAQMVAFNMQGYGRALWLMHGMFRSNGGCGYVEKPDFLMSMCTKHELFRPDAKLPVKKTLKVKVYMGDGWESDFKSTDFDSYSPPDFYTRVGIAGVPQDSVMKRTRVKKDKWTPVWDTSFTFPLRVPELALLRVEVHEYDIEQDDFGGQTCLPVPALELRPGIRAVPLFDKKGKKYDSVRLLMRFEFV